MEEVADAVARTRLPLNPCREQFLVGFSAADGRLIAAASLHSFQELVALAGEMVWLGYATRPCGTCPELRTFDAVFAPDPNRVGARFSGFGASGVPSKPDATASSGLNS